jgi:hypothetical protein
VKHIGYRDGGDGWSRNHTGPIPATQLFIPNPGERENIDAEAWKHVGWIIPGDIRTTGGKIYDTHMMAGEDGRPAYVRRVQTGSPVSQNVVAAAPTPFKRIVGPSIQSKIPTDELISEALEFCDTELGGWDGVDVEIGCERAGVYIRELVRRLQSPSSTATDGLGSLVQAEQPMTFYDHAFIAAYFDLKPAGYDDVTHMQRAHAIAAKLTRNRAVPS